MRRTSIRLQGHAEKDQRPETGAMDQVVERARAVRDVACIEQRLGERKQQQRQNRDAQRRQAAAPVAPKLPRGSVHAADPRWKGLFFKGFDPAPPA